MISQVRSFFSSLITQHSALLVCAVFSVLALIYADHVPPFESSDEAAHFLYVHTLLTDHTLPVIASREQLLDESDVVKRWSVESHQPPLYYLIGAVLVSGTSRADLEVYLRPNPLIFLRGIPQDNPNVWLHPPISSGDTQTAVWILRLYSLTLSTFSLWLIYQTAWLAFASRRIALTAMLMVAFIPTYLNIGSSVNNDNLVILLYTAGVYWCIKTWRDGLRPRDRLLIGFIAAGIALTKITGLTLLGIVGVALVIGVRGKCYTLRQALLTFTVILVMVIGLAGWWYARNWTLYGDPLATAATQTVWGRDFAVAGESGDVLAEISRVWRSFWAMVGHLHQPVYGSAWGYVYMTAATLLAVIGFFKPQRSQKARYISPLFSPRHSSLTTQLFFALIIALQIALLLYGTLSVDISYGRLLFPALVAFTPLMALGWTRLIGRYAPVLLLPLVLYALLFPFTTLRDAYPQPQLVSDIPVDAIPVNAVLQDGTTTLVAYRSETFTATPDDTLDFTLYLTQPDARNPALFVTVLDSITLESLGTMATYPALMPTDALGSNQIYAVPIHIQLESPTVTLSPRQLKLQVGWQTALETTYLPLTVNGSPAETVILNAALLIDPRYHVTLPDVSTHAIFGEAITLEGYTLDQAQVNTGDTLTLALQWRTIKPPVEAGEWVAAVQLLNADATALITQDDGEILGYPSTLWREGVQTSDLRTLTIPADTQSGTYRLYVGWYRLGDFQRLAVTGTDSHNHLYALSTPVIVK